MIKNKKLLLILVILNLSKNLSPIDNAHFYKTPHLYKSSTTCWFDELEKYEVSNWYTKIDASYAYGSTSKCWNKDGHTAPLLNATGNYNMLYLMENVQTQPDQYNFATFLSNAIINHSKTNNTFGELEFDGKFKINEFNIDLRQNLVENFFIEAHLPIRHVKLYNISYTDKSPETGIYSQQYWAWKQFKNQLNTLLSNYDLKDYDSPYSKTGFGATSLLVGWQSFSEKNKHNIKFIGFGIKGGILFPTGTKEKTDQVFSMPTGYNKHWGVPLAYQLDFGFFKWLTFSTDGSINIFLDKKVTKRMTTHSKQNGQIKLAEGKATEEKGNLWHIGFDLKFDHIWEGLSGLVGYSYSRRDKDYLTPKNTTLFNATTVNTDLTLNAWFMHVLHFIIDYDFSIHMENSHLAPRINLFYNYPLDGKNAYKTDMLGAGLGLDIRWKI